MDTLDSFYRLTPFVVMEALERVDLRGDGSCLQLNSLENRVYDLGLEDGSHVVAKFYRPGRWTEDQIREEHLFLAKLAAEEIPVCAPLTWGQNETLGEIEGIFFALWPRTGGRQTDEFSSEQLKMLGRYLGRIHSLGESLPFSYRAQLNCDRMIDQSIEIINNLTLENSFKERFTSLAQQIGEIYVKASMGIPLISLHGDCHTGNLLNDGKGFFFLDFDDAMTGPAVQDLWMLLGGNDSEYEQRQGLILEGYRTFMPFEESWLKLIEPLRAMRMVYYAGWVAKRHEDPAFQHAFPDWGSKDYWENEILDLEKQICRCVPAEVARHTLPSLASLSEEGENPEELSNSDYFFDWDE